MRHNAKLLLAALLVLLMATEFSDRFEAGIVLTGTEVKSIRAGRANLKDATRQLLARAAQDPAVLPSLFRGLADGDDVVVHRDDLVVMPYTTFSRRVMGSDRVAMMMASAVSADRIDEARAQITSVLRHRRHVRLHPAESRGCPEPGVAGLR